MIFECRRPAALITVCTLLVSCVTTAPPPGINQLEPSQKESLWQIRKPLLESINQWKIRGKIGVKTGSKGGSATLKWRYQGGNQRIELYGPFGGGRIIITADSSGAVLKDTKGRVIKGATASEVLYERLGWHVPFNQLVHWVRGLPDGSAHSRTLDDDGRLRSLTQDNWDITYQAYKQVAGAPVETMLPTRLNISAVPGTIEIYSDKGEYLGDQLSVKVILQRWSEIALVR